MSGDTLTSLCRCIVSCYTKHNCACHRRLIIYNHRSIVEGSNLIPRVVVPRSVLANMQTFNTLIIAFCYVSSRESLSPGNTSLAVFCLTKSKSILFSRLTVSGQLNCVLAAAHLLKPKISRTINEGRTPRGKGKAI